MHRLTAKLVLLGLLLSTLGPAALAVSAPAPHTCCMRKMHGHPSHEAAFDAASCCQHDCCGSLAISHFAQAPSSANAPVVSASDHFFNRPSSVGSASELGTSHSGRAPPQFFLG